MDKKRVDLLSFVDKRQFSWLKIGRYCFYYSLYFGIKHPSPGMTPKMGQNDKLIHYVTVMLQYYYKPYRGLDLCVCVSVCMCVCVYVCLCVCASVCMCVCVTV